MKKLNTIASTAFIVGFMTKAAESSLMSGIARFSSNWCWSAYFLRVGNFNRFTLTQKPWLAILAPIPPTHFYLKNFCCLKCPASGPDNSEPAMVFALLLHTCKLSLTVYQSFCCSKFHQSFEFLCKYLLRKKGLRYGGWVFLCAIYMFQYILVTCSIAQRVAPRLCLASFTAAMWGAVLLRAGTVFLGPGWNQN